MFFDSSVADGKCYGGTVVEVMKGHSKLASVNNTASMKRKKKDPRSSSSSTLAFHAVAFSGRTLES